MPQAIIKLIWILRAGRGFMSSKRIVAKLLPEKAASSLCDELEHDPDGILFSSSFDKVGERQAMVLNRF